MAKKGRYICQLILIAGLVLRWVVFCYLPPQNNDRHEQVITHIHNSHLIPPAAAYNQAYHPPLYHALAAFFLHFGDIKTTQYLSLLLSWASLLIIYRVIMRLPYFNDRIRPWCLILPSFHPQFVIYTLLVSNDTLSILLGALIFDQALRCLERPSFVRQAVLALWLGLGLLTKYTFLAFIVPVTLFISIINARITCNKRTKAYRLASLLLLAVVMGGYRYTDNAIRYGNPLINNLDFPNGWVGFQRPTWRGISTLLDINILKLIREPVITPATAHSWPLLLYGSFWYTFIPECGFLGNLTRLKILGSLIYLAALAPTLLMAIGFWSWLKTWPRYYRTSGKYLVASALPMDWEIYKIFPLLILLGTLMLMMCAGWKYDVWSLFQGRLLFPAYMTLLLLMHEGLQKSIKLHLANFGTWILFVLLCTLFLLYFATEIDLIISQPIHPSTHFYMADYTLDMNLLP